MANEYIKNSFNKVINFFKEYHLYVIDIIFGISIIVAILINLWSYMFIYKTNAFIFQLMIPLILIFVWIGIRSSKLDKGHLLTSASIIFAVFIYFLSFAYSDDSKIKILSSAHSYNCSVIQEIFGLEQKPEIWQGFTLHFFIAQPYFDNASFLLQKLGTTTGIQLLNYAYDAQGANSLISQVQSLNIQGSNPLLGQFVKENIKMYNEELLKFASSTTNIFCKNLWSLP